MSAPRVFISHSHADRDRALRLDRVLREHRAETFLDQDRLEAGDELTAELEQGIEWCTKFLLLWSAHAARSRWVELEWNAAYDARKAIIPYRLDAHPFPEVLEGRIYVDVGDQERAHGGLLAAVFGRGYRPADPTTLFPGRWQLLPATGGMIETATEVELRPNGQVVGSVEIGGGGLWGQLLGSSGMGHFADLKAPVEGRWSYEEGTEILTIETLTRFMGQTSQQVLQIRTTGKERGQLQGRDLMGNLWNVRRLS